MNGDKKTSMDHHDIAVIGVGCRFPGGISDLSSFWEVLINNKDVISKMPENRLGKLEEIVDRDRNPGKIVIGEGGFFENIESFDAAFFNISAREAEVVDPQQRILLEISHEAFEHAGLKMKQIANTKTGVYMGQWTSDYENRIREATKDIDLYATTGTGRYAAAGRVSYSFNLQGPSMTVDTACSSSLVTIHLACQALRAGEIKMGLAGGVNVILDNFVQVGYSKSKILSDYGRCRFGDITGSGYVRSEGAGVVVLKRMEDALRDGDKIHGVIKGSWINNDGQSNKYLVAPSDITQAEMLRDAYKSANVDPAEVQYIEAHGTGTKAGDPVEFKALGAVVGKGRDLNDKCVIGSVKTNIGHTESASGVAGFIKALLAIKYRQIPASLHMNTPNPNIDWSNTPFRLTQQNIPFPHPEKKLIVGVNSFGITGTNAHVIIEEGLKKELSDKNPKEKSAYTFGYSAKSEEALKAYTELYEAESGDKNLKEILTLVSNVHRKKSDFNYRNAITFKDKAGLISAFEAIKKEEDSANVYSNVIDEGSRAKVAFVFPGQGAQWNGMGKQLYEEEDVFKQVIDECETAFSKFGNWSLREELFRENGMKSIDVIQPALVAMEVGLAKLWMSKGIVPAAVIGHSMGEAASAYMSGAISLDEMAAVICGRSTLMKRTSGNGAMGYVAMPIDDVQKELGEGTQGIGIGVNNSPNATVVSGEPNLVDDFLTKMEAKGIFSKRVKVDVASHSPQMDQITEELRTSLSNLQPKATTIDFYSSVEANKKQGTELNADYWVGNLRNTVQFAAAIQGMVGDGFNVFIEMSPHPVLVQAISENIEAKDVEAHAFGTLKRNEDEYHQFMLSVGMAFCYGVDIKWDEIYGNTFEDIALPNYPWQRKHFWIDESNQVVSDSARRRDGSLGHPLLMKYTDIADEQEVYIWETPISLADFPYLEDHKVHDTVVFPAAAYLEMVGAGVTEIFGSGDHIFENVRFKEAFPIQEKGIKIVQLAVKKNIGDGYHFKISSSEIDQPDIWNKHVEGTILANQFKEHILDPLDNIEQWKQGLFLRRSKEDHYQLTNKIGLPYGEAFQGVDEIIHNDSKAYARISLPAQLKGQSDRYSIHPSILDACFQAIFTCIADEDNPQTHVPTLCKSMKFQNFFAHPLTDVQVLLDLERPNNKQIIGTLRAYDMEGQLVFELNELLLESIEGGFGKDRPENWMYNIVWSESDRSIFASEELESVLYFKGEASLGQIENYLRSKSKDLILVAPGESFAQHDSGYTMALSNKGDMSELVRSIKESQKGELTIVYDWINFKNSSFDIELDNRLTMSFVYLLQAIQENELSIKSVNVVTSNVTRNGDKGEVNLFGSALWGMGRVILNEHPDLNLRRIDLEVSSDEEIDSLIQVISSDTDENEISLSRNQILLGRLLNYEEEWKTEAEASLIPKSDKAYRVVTDEPGLLDNLVLRELVSQPLAVDEIEVKVEALGVNFMNLMSALGIYPGVDKGFASLGVECAGVVSRIGSEVDHITVGDKVMGMAWHTMASHAIMKASLMRKIPAGMSFTDAATIPVVFLTSYYALVTLGRLKKGERVLIHSATGGVGLSSIQIAQDIGAEVFATAGTEEKRQLLRDKGVKYVYDSRSLLFADQIKKDTNGEGIDMVLNSLTGEAMLRSLHLLRSFGRFLEIGKKDVYANSKVGLEVFNRGLSYSMIDLAKMMTEVPWELGTLLEEIIPYFESNRYHPLEKQVFKVTDVKNAFDFMSKAQHIGKIIIEIEHQKGLMIQSKVKRIDSFDYNGTYLLTGGYGGLGLTFVEWMFEKGARRFLLLGRSGPKENAKEKIEILKNKGAEIQIVSVDVSDSEAMSKVIRDVSGDNPLKGIMHLAGLLDDAALTNLTAEQYKKVLAPKMNGAMNLHRATKGHDLDFFVLFSSSASLFGSPGQSAYVAANSFLDNLAKFRRSQNLPAMSINWGTVSEVGLAAESELRLNRLEEEGVRALSPTECLLLYEMIAEENPSNIGLFKFDLSKWQKFNLAAATNPFYDDLREEVVSHDDNQSASFMDGLRTIESEDQRSEAIEMKLKEKIGMVVKQAPDALNLKASFKSLGIDSLMSIQLKNQLEKEFETTISVTSFWNYANIKEYVKFLEKELNLDVAPLTEDAKGEKIKTIVEEEITETPESIDDIADDDISRLLADELENL